MEYQEFRISLMEELKKVMPGEKGYMVSSREEKGQDILQIKKNGYDLSAEMSIRNLYQISELPGHELSSLAEMIEETVKEAELVMDAAERVRNIDMKNYESVKPYLRLELKRSEQNGAFLANGIYEKQAFGALVPFIAVPFRKGEVRTRITPDMLKNYGLTQKELMKQAMENTQSEKPPQILHYNESGVVCYAVTNHKREGGATSVLYPGVLEELHQKMGTDYYVVPLNVQGILAIGKSEHVTAAQLRQLLLKENRRTDPSEWLSSKICEYSGAEKTLSVCKVEKTRGQER